MRVCKDCVKTKPFTDFYDRSDKGYFKSCKDCCKAKYHANPNKNQVIAKNGARLKNNRVSANKAQAAYKRRNPDKNAAQFVKHKAAKLKRTPDWLTEQHFMQIELFYTAAKSLTKESGIQMHVDHIVPLRGKLVSGLHVPWNLQVLPAKDNVKKSNK